MSEGSDQQKLKEHNIHAENPDSQQEDAPQKGSEPGREATSAEDHASKDTASQEPAVSDPSVSKDSEPTQEDAKDQDALDDATPADEAPKAEEPTPEATAGGEDTPSGDSPSEDSPSEDSRNGDSPSEDIAHEPFASTDLESKQATTTPATEEQPAEEAVEASPNQTSAQSDASVEETSDEEEEQPDYSNYTKEELVKATEALLKDDDIKKADRLAGEIKHHFDELEEQERQVALDKFKAEGGEEGDFEFQGDALSDRFYQAYRVVKERKTNYYQRLNQDLHQNYEDKLNILNRIREFVDSEETQVSINKLKELQAEWRSIGRVPPQHNRTLWANYHALINRFYDNRSIYFELKELDRKKNMEAKLELCKRAEAIAEEDDIKKVLRELDELHEEYKHIGPVPKEDQEALWQRFKAASDRIHDRRREHMEQFKEQLNENLEKKRALCEEIKQFADFQSESIREWNQKTKDVQALQKRWESVGPMPREKAKQTNKQFWASFKQFFAHKGEFFKKLDAQREDNLKKKEALLEQAEQLKESTDWQKTANVLKGLQRAWKEIGPVPEKQRNEIYKKFKAACDTFFERKRESNKEQETAYQQNLKAKEAICEQIETLAKEGAKDTDKLYELSEAYAKIGFVPRNTIKKIAQRYEKAVESFMNQAKELDPQQKEELKLELEVTGMKGSPRAERKLDHKEFSLRKKINRLEEDISLWKNNISFFANSKQANQLKQEYEQKIEEASAELAHLKAQLDLIENMR
jgi:hypothetical protein